VCTYDSNIYVHCAIFVLLLNIKIITLVTLIPVLVNLLLHTLLL